MLDAGYWILGLRVPGYGLRGENQTISNPKSQIRNQKHLVTCYWILGLRVAGYGLRGENQTISNPKSEIKSLWSLITGH